MVCALQQAGIEVCVVNPAAVRSFGRALVQKAKSDRIDAGLLAEYGRRCEPRLTPTVSVQQLELSALVARRDDLIGALVAERNRLNQEFLASVRRLITRSIASLERLISQVEALLEKLLVDWPLLASKVNVLVAVRGVGKLTALSLLAHLPHLGCFSAAQIASISGTAPFVRQSGQWKGKSFTGGGKPRVRSSLYMAALAASRSNPVLKPFYQRLRSNGKPPKLALVALMRKLIIYLNSLLKPFFPIPISCPS
jgi:transposase